VTAYHHGWSIETCKRAISDHAHKKRVRRQKQHLRAIKTPEQLRAIMLGSRHKQR